MKNSSLLILEIVWIIIGFVCIASGIRVIIHETGNRYIVFFVMALVAFAFAWLRHRQRKKDR